jgi:hypothetical protein
MVVQNWKKLCHFWMSLVGSRDSNPASSFVSPLALPLVFRDVLQLPAALQQAVLHACLAAYFCSFW